MSLVFSLKDQKKEMIRLSCTQDPSNFITLPTSYVLISTVWKASLDEDAKADELLLNLDRVTLQHICQLLTLCQGTDLPVWDAYTIPHIPDIESTKQGNYLSSRRWIAMHELLSVFPEKYSSIIKYIGEEVMAFGNDYSRNMRALLQLTSALDQYQIDGLLHLGCLFASRILRTLCPIQDFPLFDPNSKEPCLIKVHSGKT